MHFYKIRYDLLLIFFSGIVAFYAVPIFMIGASPSDYQIVKFDSFIKIAFFYSFFSIIFTTLLYFILRVCGFPKLSTFFVVFVLSFIVFSGFIFPVSLSAENIKPINNLINTKHVFICFTFSLFFSFISLTRLKVYSLIFLFISIFLPTNAAIFKIYKYNNNFFSFGLTHSDQLNLIKNHESLKLSEKKNILVISFDALQADLIHKLIKSNEKFSKSFKDFIFFTNSKSTSPSTIFSLLGDIYGVQNIDISGKSAQFIYEDLDSKFKTPDEYIEDTYQRGFHLTDIKSMPNLNSSRFTIDFMGYPIIRMGTRLLWKLLIKLKFTDFLKTFFFKSTSDYEKIFINHKGPIGDYWTLKDIKVFDENVSNLSKSNKSFSLRYLHYYFTHNPVDFDEHCIFRSDNLNWFDNNQNLEGVNNQSICALNKFILFLNKLKKLNLYDNSLVILKSDHGYASPIFIEHPNNLGINENRWLGYSRYRALLMIKDFNSDNENLIYKNENVVTNDIAKTICVSSKLDINCDLFPGINLLDQNYNLKEPYYILTVKGKEASCCKPDDYFLSKIPSRHHDLFDEMKKIEHIRFERTQDLLE